MATIQFELKITTVLTFEQFKEMFQFPDDEMYTEIWNKMVKNSEKTKYGYHTADQFINDMTDKDEVETKTSYTMNDMIEHRMADAYSECKAEYYEKKEQEIKKIMEENKPKEKKVRKLRTKA